MTPEQIREIFLANGFRIHAGSDDLSPYVYRAARVLLEAAHTIAAPAQEDNSVLRPGKAREEYLLRMLLDCFKQVGVGDGTRGWIEHADEDEILKRDTLSFEGELTFGFEAIHELIAGLKVVAFAPAQEPVAHMVFHPDGLNMGPYRFRDEQIKDMERRGLTLKPLVYAAPAVQQEPMPGLAEHLAGLHARIVELEHQLEAAQAAPVVPEELPYCTCHTPEQEQYCMKQRKCRKVVAL